MITVRRADERGHADHGWLNSYHTFSFANYYDPRFTGFRNLLVINEDRVAAAQGFGRHSHRDMEIVSYVLEGELDHQDSMGNGSTIRPGDVQVMSAGRGVTHSEQNHSQSAPVHFLQIWLLPERKNLAPGYDQKHFPVEDRRSRLRQVVSPDGQDDSLIFNADARLYSAVLKAGERVELALQPGRHGWVQVARGSVQLNDVALATSDGAAISDEERLSITATTDAEVLVFDLS